MSGPRCVHLLCADEALRQGYRHSGAHIAVCGELVDATSLPSPRCPDECNCEIAYCPACLRAATERVDPSERSGSVNSATPAT